MGACNSTIPFDDAVGFRQRKALIIGINYEEGAHPLRGCVNDARNVQRFLIKKAGFREKDIVMMTDESSTKRDLLPTRYNIMKQIEKLTDDVQEHDLVYIHYSGHGSSLKSNDPGETDGRDETLVPLDVDRAGMITDNDLRTNLVNRMPKGAKLMCVFDCCHSGTVLDLRYVLKPPSRTGSSPRTKEDFSDEMRDDSPCEVLCLSGCRDDQTSADAYLSGIYQGALTSALLNALKHHLPIRLTLPTLLNEIRRELQENGFPQIAQLTVGRLNDLESTWSLQ